MGVKAVTWAFEQPLAGNMKVVLLCLADHFNDEKEQCWPSISRLIQRSCVSKSTVLRCLASLEKAGYIIVEHRVRKNGSKTSNGYRLNFDRVSQGVSGGVNLTPSPSVTDDTTPSVTDDTTRTVIKNRNKEPLDISYDLEFEEFWCAYPKRPGNPKKSAKLKYIAARKRGVSHVTIMAGVNAYAKSREGEDPKFTKLAETWLNKECWESDYTLDGGTNRQEPSASDADLDKLAAAYSGHIGERSAAKKLLAAEMAKGTTLDALCEAAKKYSLYCKGPPYEDRRTTPAMLETWLRFKWREMDAYEFCKVGPDQIRTVRPKKATR